MRNNNKHNPDVLTCLANLSSDEVFTPPKMANEILDLLPPEIWSDRNSTFLDPVCKSGVFLREIAKRLDAGLEKSYLIVGSYAKRQQAENMVSYLKTRFCRFLVSTILFHSEYSQG